MPEIPALEGRLGEDPIQIRAGLDGSYEIVEPGNDRCRGRVDIESIDWQRGTARLQVWVSPRFRSRGYARNALRLIAVWLLDRVGLSQLQLDVPLDDEPMLTAAAAAAFRPIDEVDVEHARGDHVLLVRNRELLD
jgi:RimJ/RimL family protein N-acetyltransferase